MTMSRIARSKDQEVTILVDHEESSKRRRVSPRNWERCLNIPGLPTKHLCSGCSNIFNSSSNKPWSEYKSPKFQCFQGWKRDGEQVNVGMRSHVDSIKEWIAENKNVVCEVAFEAPVAKKGRPNVSPRVLLQTPSPVPTTTTEEIRKPVITTTGEHK